MNSWDIPFATFKVLPKYERMVKTLCEHYQDMSYLALSFNISNESIITHLLEYSFKGKVNKWFKILTPQSITTWGQLCQAFIKRFTTDGDDSSFLSFIACIKRYSNEMVDDFNTFFEKTWNSIPIRIRPINAQALVYYRKAFHPTLNMLIIIFGYDLPKIYQIVKNFEHILVSSRKLQPNSLMPPFPNIPPK